VSLPEAEVADLPNGLHVMVLEDRRALVVTVQMVIRAVAITIRRPHRPRLQFAAANLREGTAT
jgi:hypothetical protein